jgi:hypothetical protein
MPSLCGETWKLFNTCYNIISRKPLASHCGERPRSHKAFIFGVCHAHHNGVRDKEKHCQATVFFF